MAKKIKPKTCPFCGSQPEVFRAPTDSLDEAGYKAGWYVECKQYGETCPCIVCCVGPYPTKKEAIEFWNQREGSRE